MPPTVALPELQAYLRSTATLGRDVVRIPPFTACFDRDDPLDQLNFAVPDDGTTAPEGAKALDKVRRAFAERGRAPRFEFLDVTAPALPPVLERAGFALQLRTPVMIAGADTLAAPPPVAGLAIVRLEADASREELRAFLDVQHDAYAEHGLQMQAGGDPDALRGSPSPSFLGRLDGAPAAIGAFAPPRDGFAEVGGIGTRVAARGRGIGGAMAYTAARAALSAGASVVFLTPGGDGSRRVYARVGFRDAGTMLHYIARDTP